MQRTCVQHQSLLLHHCVLRRKSTPHATPSRCFLLARKLRLHTAASAQGPNDKQRPADQKPAGSAGSGNQKFAAEKARDDAQAAAAGKPAPGNKPAPQPAQEPQPAPQPVPKPQPARQPAQSVSREASKAPPKPQAQPPRPAAWDQAAASDWGPTENKRDFFGTIVNGFFFIGAFVLTTALFRTIAGYKASHPPKPASTTEAQQADSKQEQTRSAQEAYAAKANDAKASADDGEAGNEQRHDDEGQNDDYSAAFDEGQHPEDKDGYSFGDGAWSDSDENRATPSWAFSEGQASQGRQGQSGSEGADHAEAAVADALEKSLSNQGDKHDAQDSRADQDSHAEQADAHAQQQGQSQQAARQQQAGDEAQPPPEPQVPAAYREPKKAWKKVQRTGHLAPAPGATELKIEHKFSDEISVDALKERVAAAMKASASAGEASRHASGWSAAASQSASKAASAAHRASSAASTCQAQLENLVENDTSGLKDRIAAAEAAVSEAERAAEEAVDLQNEVVKAASMAEGHSDVASRQSGAAEQAIAPRSRDRRQGQNVFSNIPNQLQGAWQEVVYQLSHFSGSLSTWFAAAWLWIRTHIESVVNWLQYQFARLRHSLPGSSS